MASQLLPPIGSLASASDAVLMETLDLLFEPSPAIHSTLLPVITTRTGNAFSSYSDLIQACHAALLSLAPDSASAGPSATLLSVVGAHPRLGEKKVESAQSAAEQASLAGQREQLAKLNREYEERYPGLRYVVFVNGRDRQEIMQDMRARIDGSTFAAEVRTALKAMCDIANDRASKLATQPRQSHG
ncbi:hypothetical protein CDD82_7903 [Ophiocordyceps australis]|uniref:Oxo-4-hydroxy-4-carboxy-5-ureidoimidazoline decarboxylase domain-containing protein n=1 Tax=Ophiocordyceps australis TaxID=1399860 RepID=A0A2C5YQC8_9HYPO|nr:hypothetical protein CDD82_7903 [Ophiocordyceps australis]